jgi:hypothetical protein
MYGDISVIVSRHKQFSWLPSGDTFNKKFRRHFLISGSA